MSVYDTGKPLPCGHTVKSWKEQSTRDGLCYKCDMKRKRREQRHNRSMPALYPRGVR